MSDFIPVVNSENQIIGKALFKKGHSLTDVNIAIIHLDNDRLLAKSTDGTEDEISFLSAELITDLDSVWQVSQNNTPEETSTKLKILSEKPVVAQILQNLKPNAEDPKQHISVGYYYQLDADSSGDADLACD